MTQTVRTDDGIAIEYKLYGSGPLTLLFLHGWGNAANAWDDFLTTRLNLAGLRCVAASYRGHGGSDEARLGYTHERFARDMFAVADAIGADRFVMVGFSMAGKFGRYMAHLNAGRLLAQVLIAPLGPEKLDMPREALNPWLEAAAFPRDPTPVHEAADPGGFARHVLPERITGLASRAGGNHRYVL